MWGLLGSVLVVESDSSRKVKEGPVIPQELPSAERVTCRRWDSFTSSDDSLSIILLSPTHLHWVKRASQDGAGLLEKLIKSPPASCWDAAAPADYAIENGWCHHRVIGRSQGCPLHPKGPELPQQMESALTFSCINSQHCQQHSLNYLGLLVNLVSVTH